MKVIVYGDFHPRNRGREVAKAGKYESLFSEVKAVNEAYDYRIANLECPVVTGEASPIAKDGPCIKCGEEGPALLGYAHFDCVTLANNHFRDYGEEGVRQTLQALQKHGIDHVGGGRRLDEASRTLFKEVKGATLAIVNCAEHESSIATDSRGGSNPLDPIRQYRAIKEARAQADYVVVIVHGGVEHYDKPTPRMQECYRFFVDAGADAVVNHHQHCFSGYEVYQGKPIFYGLGNFFFDNPKCVGEGWNKGYAVGLNLEDGRVEFQLIPYLQCSGQPGWTRLDEKEEAEFLQTIGAINAIIADPTALKKAHLQFLEEHVGLNEALLTPYTSYWAEALCEKGWLPNYYPKKKLVVLLNRIECESHRERLIHYINHRLGR